MNEREKVINEMLRKTRYIEFERGLRDMLRAGEKEDVVEILKAYNLL